MERAVARHYEPTETRRCQIAEAALQVIAEEGLGRFTTRAIASRVGITDGTLFRHFRDKEEIVLAAMDLLEEEMQAGQPDAIRDPLERLEHLFRHRAAFVGARGAVGRLIFSDQLVHVAGTKGQAKLQSWHTRNIAMLTACARELEREGRLVGGVSVEATVRVVQGMIVTFAVRRTIGLSPDADKAFSEEISAGWSTLRTLLFR